MKAYQDLFKALRGTELEPWSKLMPEQIEKGLSILRHGNLDRWQQVVDSLPDYNPDYINLSSSAITVTQNQALNDDQQAQLEQRLKQLMPWRKGPYHIHGVDIDTEWRSDWKWDRLKQQIAPLNGRRVLDVGCGDGEKTFYISPHVRWSIGIDPDKNIIKIARKKYNSDNATPHNTKNKMIQDLRLRIPMKSI